MNAQVYPAKNVITRLITMIILKRKLSIIRSNLNFPNKTYSNDKMINIIESVEKLLHLKILNRDMENLIIAFQMLCSGCSASIICIPIGTKIGKRRPTISIAL
jgi:hypothetical protein